MCVLMLKPCNSAGIWWYIMCWNWKCICVFYSEFVIPFRNWVVSSELRFASQLCVLQRIWNSLSKLSCLQQINIRCWIVCSLANLGFTAEVVWFVVNLKFTAEIEFLQQINIHCWIVCSAANLGFTAEVQLSPVNLKFAYEIELFATN